MLVAMLFETFGLAINADVMVLFAESMEELQDLLEKIQIIVHKVNPENSKVVIFGNKSRHRSPITFNDRSIAVVDCFKYMY